MSIALKDKPKLGEIRTGTKCGYTDTGSYIWHACPDCGKERWVQLRGTDFMNRRCAQCAQLGSRNATWKGGIKKSKQGYIYIRKRNHPYAHVDGRVARARLVLKQKLGRYLLPNMEVHHLNGIRDDDSPENLVEISPNKHRSLPRRREKCLAK